MKGLPMGTQLILFSLGISASICFVIFNFYIIPYWKNAKVKAMQSSRPTLERMKLADDKRDLAKLEAFFDSQIKDAKGWANGCLIAAVISVSLAVINILP